MVRVRNLVKSKTVKKFCIKEVHYVLVNQRRVVMWGRRGNGFFGKAGVEIKKKEEIR